MGAAQWTSKGCSFGLEEGGGDSQQWLVDMGVGVGGDLSFRDPN